MESGYSLVRPFHSPLAAILPNSLLYRPLTIASPGSLRSPPSVSPRRKHLALERCGRPFLAYAGEAVVVRVRSGLVLGVGDPSPSTALCYSKGRAPRMHTVLVLKGSVFYLSINRASHALLSHFPNSNSLPHYPLPLLGQPRMLPSVLPCREHLARVMA